MELQPMIVAPLARESVVVAGGGLGRQNPAPRWWEDLVKGRAGNSGGTREPSSQKESGFAEIFLDFEVFTELNSKKVSEITAKIICFA